MNWIDDESSYKLLAYPIFLQVTGNNPPPRSGTENQALWNIDKKGHHNQDPTKELGKTGKKLSIPPLTSQYPQTLLIIDNWAPVYTQPPLHGGFNPNRKTEFYTSLTKDGYPTAH